MARDSDVVSLRRLLMRVGVGVFSAVAMLLSARFKGDMKGLCMPMRRLFG